MGLSKSKIKSKSNKFTVPYSYIMSYDFVI